MPPVMNRKSSTARAAEAWRLHVRGRTWQEIADELGFKSRQSANKAVKSYLQKNPPADIDTMRRARGDLLADTTARLHDCMCEAIEAGKFRDAAELGKVVLDGVDKRAKLEGLHIAVPQVLDLNVTQTMSEILTDTRARLQAAIDAEVVELPAGEETP